MSCGLPGHRFGELRRCSHGSHASIQAPEKTEQCNSGSDDGKNDLASVAHAEQSSTSAASRPKLTTAPKAGRWINDQAMMAGSPAEA